MGDLPRKVALKWRPDRTDADGRTYLALRITWPDGRQEDRGIGYRTPEEAERERARVLLGDPRESGSSSAGTVADVLAHYVADVEKRRPGSSYASRQDYCARHLGRHLGRLRAEAVTTARLRAYLNARSAEPTPRGGAPARSALFAELRTLRAAYALSRDEGRLACDPPALPARKTLADDSRPARRLSHDEVGRLVATAYGWGKRTDGEVLGALVSVLAWSGRRPVAIWGLRYRDCSRLHEGLVYWVKDKGGEGRGWSPISQGARAALEQLLERRPGIGARLVFEGWGGQALTTDHFGRYWMHTLTEAAGLSDVTAYDLRRHACTAIVEACLGNLRTAMEFTGHTHPETLLRYLYAPRDAALNIASEIGPRGQGRGQRSDQGGGDEL